VVVAVQIVHGTAVQVVLPAVTKAMQHDTLLAPEHYWLKCTPEDAITKLHEAHSVGCMQAGWHSCCRTDLTRWSASTLLQACKGCSCTPFAGLLLHSALCCACLAARSTRRLSDSAERSHLMYLNILYLSHLQQQTAPILLSTTKTRALTIDICPKSDAIAARCLLDFHTVFCWFPWASKAWHSTVISAMGLHSNTMRPMRYIVLNSLLICHRLLPHRPTHMPSANSSSSCGCHFSRTLYPMSPRLRFCLGATAAAACSAQCAQQLHAR
jgi:hypothetical protein